MRRVLIAGLAAAALWSGYWLAAARFVDTGLQGWLAARRAEGWAADARAIAVTGFPARFAVEMTDLSLADPETGLAWSMPDLQVAAASHRPFEVAVTWPETQEIATPDESIAVGVARMTAALHLRPGPALAPREARFDLGAASFVSSTGWEASVDRARLQAIAEEGTDARYRIAFDAGDMRPPAGLVQMLDRAGILPALFQRLEIAATLSFDTAWDRRAIEERRPQITHVDLDRSAAQWGDLALEAAGAFAVDAAGQPEGTLTLRATNWRDMLAIARASGQLSEGLADSIEGALALLAGLSGRPETLDVPLRFAGGLTWLGPVPVGPAPDFTIR